MNAAELSNLPAKELVSMAADLGIKAKGKNPRDLIPLIIKALDGEPEEGEGSDEQPSKEEIIAGEANLLDAEDDETAAPEVDFDGMTEEQVLEHQLKTAEEQGQHPAVVASLINALDSLRAKEAAPVEQPHHAVQGVSAAPIKAGSHYPTVAEVRELLAGHVKRGLAITAIKDHQHMLHLKHGHRETAVSLKQPLRNVLMQANILMRPTGKPTEDLSYEEILADKVAQKTRR